MITGKGKSALVKLSAALLTALCILLCVSCSDKGDNDDVLDALSSLKSDAMSGIAEKATDYYRVVIPGDSTPELALLARGLAERIEDKTGIACGVAYDTEDVPLVAGAIEILLGNTNRNSSAAALRDMRSKDFVCRFVDGSLVIGGLSEQATLSAVDRFVSEILPYATASALMVANGGFESFGEYELDSVLLCGFDIGDYTVVCSEDRELAEFIRDTVAGACGQYLEISDGAAVGKKEIRLLNDKTSDTACYITRDNEDILIGGADTYQRSVAAVRFCELLLSSVSDKTASFDVSEHNFSCQSAELAVVYLVSNVGVSENELSDIIALAETVNNCAADVIAFGEINADAFSMLCRELSANLAVIQRDGYAPILYRRDKVTPVTVTADGDSGAKRCLVEFSHTASNEKYTVLSICADGTASSTERALDMLGESANAVAMLCCPVLDGQLPDVSETRADLLYSFPSTLNDKEYFMMSVLKDGNACGSAESPQYFGDNKTCLVSLTVEKLYSEEYLRATGALGSEDSEE